ncbi:MAG: SDR family oxidoreductase [Holosporales bacterium]|jgi:hypothetical protein
MVHDALFLGAGYTAGFFAEQWNKNLGFASIYGTSRRGEVPLGIVPVVFDGQQPIVNFRRVFSRVSHILVSIPPSAVGDPVLRLHHNDLSALPVLQWVGYLSTTGVYGDYGGAWVDEDSPCRAQTERGIARVEAEKAWLQFGAQTGIKVQVFRLAGIYGPGRNAIEDVRQGVAHRLAKPGQVFSRIHVQDIVRAVEVARLYGNDAIYNVADDMPCPGHEVVAYAAELLGVMPPPLLDVEKVAHTLSPMTRSFYAECKRVRNTRIKALLPDGAWQYPDYRKGLQALL